MEKETTTIDPPRLDPNIGMQLGSYRILALLGEGGMGKVYRAEHVRLGRKVAIKALRKELASRADVVARFFREARSVNDIGHSNIIDVSDFVEKRDEDPPLVYMVMELLSGQDLACRIQAAGTLDPEEAVSVATQIADALIAVHRNRILHRDLKPENIFLVAQDEGKPKVKLLDFGVAKAFGEGQKVNLTNPGTCVGTPEFMAPEQIMGRPLDDRTDIYSLGIVLYSMLTGAVPFQSSRLGELMISQVKEAPPPIADKRREGAPVPPGLEAVIMRCLEKDPANRFQNARQLREALGTCLQGGPTTSPGSSHGPRFASEQEAPFLLSQLRSRRKWLVVGAVAVLGLGGGVMFGLWADSRGRTPADQATEHLDRPAGSPPALPTPKLYGPNSQRVVTGPPVAVDPRVPVGKRADGGIPRTREMAHPASRDPREPRRVRSARRRRSVLKAKNRTSKPSRSRGSRGRTIHGMMDPFAK